MKAYFTLTAISLRRRPSLFPGTRSPSVVHGPVVPAPSAGLQPGTLSERQRRLVINMLGPPGIHPVPQRLSHQTILPGDISDRPRLVDDLPNRCFLEFSRIRIALAWHYSSDQLDPMLLGLTLRIQWGASGNTARPAGLTGGMSWTMKAHAIRQKRCSMRGIGATTGSLLVISPRTRCSWTTLAEELPRVPMVMSSASGACSMPAQTCGSRPSLSL